MIRVLVCGARGKMGSTTVDAVSAADDMELVGGVDPHAAAGESCPGTDAPLFTSLSEAIEATNPEVMVDFTNPSVVEENLRCALGAGVACVVGTTGLSEEKLADIAKTAQNGAALFFASNFTTGAVLMMQFAKAAAAYFPDIEIIEMHHDGKKDSPSGTAVTTARLISEGRTQPSNAPGSETEMEGMEGARGALVDGVPIHSVRTDGHVAHQEVILGSSGQTLTIRHDSIDRSSYMPGVLLAIRNVQNLTGLTIGLENLMD